MLKVTTFGLTVFSLLGLWACSTEEEPATRRPTTSSSCTPGSPGCDTTTTPEQRQSAGELAVAKRECTKCHDSSKGKMAGSTTNLSTESGIELFAPNLTDDYETGIGSWTDDAVVIAIRTGLDKDGLNLCPQMNHFSEMEDDEAYAIVTYLRSLPVVVNEVPRSVCPPLKVKEEQ